MAPLCDGVERLWPQRTGADKLTLVGKASTGWGTYVRPSKSLNSSTAGGTTLSCIRFTSWLSVLITGVGDLLCVLLVNFQKRCDIKDPDVPMSLKANHISRQSGHFYLCAFFCLFFARSFFPCCPAIRSGDRGQRKNLRFLTHVHCDSIEPRPSEWRRCWGCTAQALQRGT